MYPSTRCCVTGRVRRYPSDTTDAEWALITPLLPIPACRKPSGGRPETHDRRAIVDAIRYLVDNGCKWRALPADFPPWKTVHGFFTRWTASGIINQIRDVLREKLRTRAGRHRCPSAAIVDSQSVKAAETVSNASRGYDAGKKINGRKRHLVVDTCGWLLLVMVTSAGLQDRHGARDLLFRLRLLHPQITLVWADAGYSGVLVQWAATFLKLTIEIVHKIVGQTTFIALPRRWVVERTISWLTQARRNVRDYERLPQHSEAAITWAAITGMTRRLTQ